MFNIRIPKIRIEWLIIAGLAVLLLLQKCSNDVSTDKYNNTLDSLTLANQRLDSIKNDLGQKVYTQEVIITSNQEAINNLAKEKFNLEKKHEKKIKETVFYYEAKLRAKADSVFIPYEDTSQLKKFKDSTEMYRFMVDSMIQVPKRVTLDSTSQFYKDGLRFDATIQKKGLNINTVQFIDTQYIRVSKLKKNLWQTVTFKPRKYRIDVLHTSPLITIQGQNSVIYQPAKKANLLPKVLIGGGLIYLGTRL
jgi:hypothetical protein